MRSSGRVDAPERCAEVELVELEERLLVAVRRAVLEQSTCLLELDRVAVAPGWAGPLSRVGEARKRCGSGAELEQRRARPCAVVEASVGAWLLVSVLGSSLGRWERARVRRRGESETAAVAEAQTRPRLASPPLIFALKPHALARRAAHGSTVPPTSH